jgi:hypothetical protein
MIGAPVAARPSTCCFGVIPIVSIIALHVELLMKDFYLAAAAAIVITTSLASNLLWVMAFGPPVSCLRIRLRSALGGLVLGSRRLLDTWVAGVIARRARQATLFEPNHLTDRDLKDTPLRRGTVGLICAEREEYGGAGGYLQRPGAASARL